MNGFRNWIKEYNNFRKSDRHAILILGFIALISFIIAIVIRFIDLTPDVDYSVYREKLLALNKKQYETSIANKSLFYFDPNTITKESLDSLNLPDFVKQNLLNYRKSGGHFSDVTGFRKIYGMNDSIFNSVEQFIKIQNTHQKEKEKTIESFTVNTGSFDPNTVTPDELKSFGFSKFQIKNLTEYRRKGGAFKTAADLKRIYGIDSLFFQQIEAQIEIAAVEISDPVENTVLVELNSADSAKLVNLSGIGASYARRIIKYRDLLGGFYNRKQILEIYNFPVETFQIIESHISVDTLSIKKLRINFADYKELIRHPYFTKNQVQSILLYRQKNGPFREIEQLRNQNLLDEKTFAKIKPYLTCR